MNHAMLEVLEREQRDKRFARSQVQIAVRTGKLKREPCMCGEEKVEGHHQDYKKPLDVIWMCRKHHAQLHVQQSRNADEIQINPFKAHLYRR